MAIVADVKFEDNKQMILEAFNEQVNGWLQAIGEDAASTAANKVPVNTGRLKNSINWAIKGDYGSGGDTPSAEPEDKSVYIGTNVNYAIYHEFGTGIYAEEGGRTTPWMFKDEDGVWHWTHGVPARHFLQFGATAHQASYKEMLESALKH